MQRRDVKELCAKVSLVGLVGQSVLLKREGREYWGLCPFHTEKSASFKVNEERGQFYCFGCKEHGSAIDFLMKHDKLTFRQALDRLEAMAGEKRYEPLRARPAASTRRANEDQGKASAVAWCRSRWREACQADNTPVDSYLLGRGIDTAFLGGVPPSLRYHRNLWHSEARRGFWAMVGAIQDARGEVCGLHRTYLAAEPADRHPTVAAVLRAARCFPHSGEVVVKAPVKGAKKMAGIAKGGAVRLAAAAQKLAIAEGIETALSVMQSTDLPAWAALSLGNIGELTLPEVVCEVTIFADGDNKDQAAAERLLLAAAANYEAQGVRVTIARPPAGMDFNDVLLRPFAAAEPAATGM